MFHGSFQRRAYAGGALATVLMAANAFAYPEFEAYVESISGRPVNCALCHTSPDGPEGLKAGQIGSLTPDKMEVLNRARAEFDPGGDVDNPILNAFGDSIIHQLGKTRFLQLRLEPQELPNVLDQESDLDGDGITDVNELRAGTHLLDPNHGPPWQLFRINLWRKSFHLIMIVVATLLGLYGLHHLLRGFDRALPGGEAGGQGGRP